MTGQVKLVYDHDGRDPAPGRREIWIDPDTREVFLLTGDKDQGGSINQTKRKLRVVVVGATNTPPTLVAQDLDFVAGEPS